MSYMLLVMEPRGQRAERGLEGGRQAYADMGQFAASLKQRGVLLAVESLASDSKRTRMQVRNGQQQVIDGPFAEAREMVGGFFLLDRDDRDDREQVLGIAAGCTATDSACAMAHQAARSGPFHNDRLATNTIRPP